MDRILWWLRTACVIFIIIIVYDGDDSHDNNDDPNGVNSSLLFLIFAFVRFNRNYYLCVQVYWKIWWCAISHICQKNIIVIIMQLMQFVWNRIKNALICHDMDQKIYWSNGKFFICINIVIETMHLAWHQQHQHH